MILDQLLDVAISAANDSKQIINEHLNKTKVLKYKGKTDLVTLADKQSEKVIIEKNAGSGVVPYLPLPELNKKKVTN